MPGRPNALHIGLLSPKQKYSSIIHDAFLINVAHSQKTIKKYLNGTYSSSHHSLLNDTPEHVHFLGTRK